MKALVLSAGLGERLRPLTLTTPKPLLMVAGRPLLHYTLLMLKAAGVTEIAVNLHHLGDQIERALGSGARLGLTITYFRESTLTGTGGPLLALSDYFEDQSFAILNSDTIIDLRFTDLIAFHQQQQALASLVLRTSDSSAYSQIEIDGADRIRRMRLLAGRAPGQFRDYPAHLPAEVAATLTPYMYCGIMICDPAILTMLPLHAPFSLIADVLAPALSGVKLAGFIHRGFFRTVDDLPAYNSLVAEHLKAEPPLDYLK